MTIVLLQVKAVYLMFPVPLFIKMIFCQVKVFTGFRICGRICLAKFKQFSHNWTKILEKEQ
jgi:hypothetical protein